MKNYIAHKLRSRSPLEIAGIVIFGIIAIVGLGILFGYVIMWLWNWLMPEIFDLPVITYWQAVGLFILFKILLGGCSSSSSSKKCDSKSHKKSKSDFSKWEHYDKFWEEEGDELYMEYVRRKVNKIEPLDQESK